MAADKPKSSPVSILADRNSLIPQDGQGAKLFPTLMELLLPKWVDGKCVRQSGRLSMRIVGPYFVFTVSCPTEGLETSVTLASIVEALEAIERHCVDPGAIWTPTFDRQKQARKEEEKIRKELDKGQS